MEANENAVRLRTRQTREFDLHACSERLQLVQLPLIHERDDRTRLARTRRAPRAVAVGAHVLRQIKMDHIVHVLDVEPARGKIGGDEQLGTPRADGVQCRAPMIAPLLSEQGDRLDPLKAQLFERVCRVEAAPNEDESPTNRQTAPQLLDCLY